MPSTTRRRKDEVKDAIFKMHDDVAAYLGEQAQ